MTYVTTVTARKSTIAQRSRLIRYWNRARLSARRAGRGAEAPRPRAGGLLDRERVHHRARVDRVVDVVGDAAGHELARVRVREGRPRSRVPHDVDVELAVRPVAVRTRELREVVHLLVELRVVEIRVVVVVRRLDVPAVQE